MATDNIPPPPFLGPIIGPSVPSAPRGWIFYRVYSFQLERGGWSLYATSEGSWQSLPLGYYRTPANFMNIPMIVLVTARTDDSGNVAPIVLNPQDAPTAQGLDCPDGYGDVPRSEMALELSPTGALLYWTSTVNYNDTAPRFNAPISTDQNLTGPDLQQFCAVLAVQKVPTCPPGTIWDPSTETCKAIPPPPICPPGTYWDPSTETCKPIGRNPPPPPTCPAGQYWDPVTKSCKPILQPPPPSGPCIPPDRQFGDELTDGLDCVSRNLNYIQSQISGLHLGGNGQPANPDPVTCAQLTGLVNATNGWLYSISQAIAASSSGAPVDLSAVVATLMQVAVAAQSYPPVWNAIATAIGGKLDNIATAISSTGGTDVSGIVAALNKANDQGDVDQAIFDALQQQGFLSADDLQTLQGLKWSDAISYILGSKAWRYVEKGVDFIGAGPVGWERDLSKAFPGTDAYVVKKVAGAMVAERNAVQVPLEKVLATIKGALEPRKPTQLNVIGVNPDTVLADVVATALNLELTAAAIAMVFPGIAERFSKITEYASAVLGFEELRDVQIGPLVEEGIAKLATFQARAKFQQELPGTSTLQGLVAQGLLGADRAKALSLFNGTSDEMFPIQQASAYRGLNARQMLRLIETDLFSASDIADELTFSGMRPVSQSRMLTAAPYLATASERSALRSELSTAYTAGLLSDADLQTQVTAAEANTDLGGLVLARARLQKLIAETKAIETEYTTLFIGNVIDDATYRGNLGALGLQPDIVNTIAARAEARANATLHRKELAAAAREAAATQKVIDQAAIKNFMDGNIDAAALAAALIASGVIPTQAAALTDLAVLRLAGSQRWVYGLQLRPAQAALLRGRVAALTDQRKRLQIDDPTYVAQLQALGIGPKYVNALQAAADALISPKTAAFPITVKTN